VRTAVEDELLPPSELLDRGEDLEGGDGEDDFDLDIGVLIVTGPVRLGFTARNLRDLEYGAGQFTLARQMRAGAAFDVRRTSPTPLIVAVDADTVSYDTGTGERRVIAVGAEQWLLARRLGLRGGARFNTVGAEDRAGTAGVSVALRPGLFIDGHVIRGTSDGDRGWGVATRVSF
jgi:hypothetical protein